MGGSQGAVGLNRMIRALLPSLLDKGCRVIHLTGENDQEAKQLQHPNLVELSFSTEIPGLLQNADLAISRAGAGSLSELAVCGTPAILIPYPQATDQHQEINASYAAELGGALIVHQHPPEHHALKNAIWYLLDSKFKQKVHKENYLLTMHQRIKELAINNAGSKVAELITNLN